MMEKWRSLICLASASFSGFVLIILFTPISDYGHQLLRSDDQPVESDVIVILSSSMPYDTPNGLPGQSTMYRLDKGLELYRSGFAKKIIAFGGIEMGESGKTTGQWMKERLAMYGVPEKNILVKDELRGSANYYHNLTNLLEADHLKFDFSRALFVTTVDQSYRIKRILRTMISNPVVIVAEPYGLYPDWGRRVQHFRVLLNELYAIVKFSILGRFDKVSVE